MPTPTVIFTNALTDLGRIATGGSGTAADLELCRLHFNRMLGQWNTQRRFAYYIYNQAFTFSASQQSYTLGTSANSANFVITAGTERPVKIERARLVTVASTPDSESEIPVLDYDQYANISSPAGSATVPSVVYYQATYPNGTLWPVPYPTVTTNKLRLFWWIQLVSVASGDVGTNVNLPPGYEDAITLSLMESICMPFGLKISQDLKERARMSRLNIAALNSKPPMMRTDYPTSPSGSRIINPRTGNYV